MTAFTRVLREGVSKGDDVAEWQLFLHGHPSQKYVFKTARDGVFGPETKEHTIDFQTDNGLKADGVVGNRTLATAMLQGLEAVPFVDEVESHYPSKPSFSAIADSAKDSTFGPLKYKAGGNDNGKESIIITNNFESAKIVTVDVPELAGIPGGHGHAHPEFHRDGAAQLKGLWAAWGRQGLLKMVLHWDGSFVPRFIRCSTSELSNHAYGTAFDINQAQNPLGHQPALPGEPGCVFDLVPIAHLFGFYWGGHFTRRDGMHFELAVRMSQAQVDAVLAKF